MSWGIEVTGTKEAVKAKVAAYMDQAAKGYEGKAEADDVIACKARLLALIDACDFTSEGALGCNAVAIKANGSHYSTPAGIGSASFSVSVQRVSLAL